MLWLKLIISAIIISIFVGGGWYIKNVIKDNQRLTTALETSEASRKFMEDNIKEQKSNLIILDKALKKARKRKTKVVEKVIYLKSRKEQFKKGIDKTLPKDVEIEFKMGLKTLSCATKNNCNKR